MFLQYCHTLNGYAEVALQIQVTAIVDGTKFVGDKVEVFNFPTDFKLSTFFIAVLELIKDRFSDITNI